MFKFILFLLSLNLVGCTVLDLTSVEEEPQVSQTLSNKVNVVSSIYTKERMVSNKSGDAFQTQTYMSSTERVMGSNNTQSFAAGRYQVKSTKNINHYVRGIMHDLVENMQYVTHQTPIAVASFVFLDSDYNSSSILGNQIAESFVHEVHKFGIPVVDYKTSDYIRVTPTGDYVFSRDFLDLSGDAPIKYILGGTLTKHYDGYLINARVVGIDSKAVVASAQAMIPRHIADSLERSSLNDGIPLISGE